MLLSFIAVELQVVAPQVVVVAVKHSAAAAVVVSKPTLVGFVLSS